MSLTILYKNAYKENKIIYTNSRINVYKEKGYAHVLNKNALITYITLLLFSTLLSETFIIFNKAIKYKEILILCRLLLVLIKIYFWIISSFICFAANKHFIKQLINEDRNYFHTALYNYNCITNNENNISILDSQKQIYIQKDFYFIIKLFKNINSILIKIYVKILSISLKECFDIIVLILIFMAYIDIFVITSINSIRKKAYRKKSETKFIQQDNYSTKINNNYSYIGIKKEKNLEILMNHEYTKLKYDILIKIKKNIIKNEIKTIINIIILQILIVIKTVIKIETHNHINFINFKFSNITLKITGGRGKKQIFSQGSHTGFPHEVYINGKKQTTVTYQYKFNESINIVELIWYNNTIKDCERMFEVCPDITEIDLSHFDTSNVANMCIMFGKCKSLTSLNLTNFDTSKVIETMSMFSSCSSLTSLNLSSFNTSNLERMSNMFDGCISLTSLDLSNFNFSLVYDMYYSFHDCVNLEYINLKNYNDSSFDTWYSRDIFANVPENIVICINENNTKILPQIMNKTCYVIDCSNDWKSKQKKIIHANNECVNDCASNEPYIYEYNGKCYIDCSKGYLNDDNNITTNKCKCELDQCLTCPNVALVKGLCTKCNINYYQKENDPLNLGEYINCYNEVSNGYYLDKEDFLLKKCYDSCATCESKGNHIIHNCLSCNISYPFKINISNYYNCYENCRYNYYFDKEKYYHCTLNPLCPEEYPKLKEGTKECIQDNNFEKILEEIKNFNISKSITKEDEILFYDKILSEIEIIFNDGNYDTTKLDNGIDEIIDINKIIVRLTTAENQKNKINENMTILHLGECENIIRNLSNLINNETIYMLKKDINQEGMKISKIEYDIYKKLSNNKLEKLNISLC